MNPQRLVQAAFLILLVAGSLYLAWSFLGWRGAVGVVTAYSFIGVVMASPPRPKSAPGPTDSQPAPPDPWREVRND